MSFPRYDGFFGKLVARFLNGEFGPLESVDPHFSALLYAGRSPRVASRAGIRPCSGKNAAGGPLYRFESCASRRAGVPETSADEFLAWLKQLEYQVYALPPRIWCIYLRVPAAEAHRLVGEKAKRQYTELRRDLQESDLAHLQAASAVYDRARRQPNWLKIECYDAQAQALRSPEAIHKEILAAIEARVFPALHAGR